MKTTLILASCAAIVAPAAFAVEAKVVIEKTVASFKLVAEAGDICKQAIEGSMPSATAAEKIGEVESKILAIKKEILELEEKSKAEGSYDTINQEMQAFMMSDEGKALLASLQPSMEALGAAAQGSDQVLQAAVMKLVGALQ